MDLDIRTIMYIADLIGNIKKTYKNFVPNEKPRFYNRPQNIRYDRMLPRQRFWL